MQRKKKTPPRGLSGGGPYPRLLAEGTKIIDLRPWTHNYRGIVFFHSARYDKKYEEDFEAWEMTKEECPQYALLGAGILVDIIHYNSPELWYAHKLKHCWTGDLDYDYVVKECYNGYAPYGHVFADPILFNEPILEVPGSHKYWNPLNERQINGFNRAIEILRSLKTSNPLGTRPAPEPEEQPSVETPT